MNDTYLAEGCIIVRCGPNLSAIFFIYLVLLVTLSSMTDQSPGLHGNSGASSSSSRPNPYGPQNPDDLDGDDLTDLNLDKAHLNEDPLADDSDAQSVIYNTLKRYQG